MSNYNLSKAELELLPKLTDEFLETLRLAAKTAGWDLDHTATTSFVYWCFEAAGKPRPETDPLDDDETDLT